MARLVRGGGSRQRGASTLPLDVVSEIEWAKARMIPADATPRRPRRRIVDHRSTPNEVARVYASYEEDKLARRMVDFDDLLRLATRDLRADEDYAAARRWRFRHLFVDEFQDVNPLQFELLQAWLGDRVDLCVVGDPNQAIYSWNGADAVLPGRLRSALPRRRDRRALRELPVAARRSSASPTPCWRRPVPDPSTLRSSGRTAATGRSPP